MFSKFRVVLLGFVAAIFFVQTGWTQDKKIDSSVERMKKDIFFLASEECEGRGVGTQGLNLAGEYIAASFRKAGLKPGGHDGTYFQPFPFATNAQADGESTLALVSPNGERIALKQGVDFTVIGTSGPGLVSAPLAFVGYGVTAKNIDYDDYKGIDVKDKAVIALRRLPRWNDKDRPFDGVNKDELAALDVKQYRGEHHRAAAVILINDASELPNDGLTVFKTTFGVSTRSVPFVHVKRAALESVIKSATGKSLANVEKGIDEDLKPRSAVLTGWSVDLNVKIKRKVIPVRNVIGYIDGKGPLKDQIVVVGAHYDHVGYANLGGSRDGPKGKGKLHYGADDNASGSTSVMELARRFAAKKNTDGRKMVFMTFTAEENGLIGSRHYCTVDPLFPLKDTTAMFNLDMVGRLNDNVGDGAKPKLLVEGHYTAKHFEEMVTKLNPGFDIVKQMSRGFVASDQLSFYNQKIPVMFFWTGEHPDYHSPRDTAEKINVSGMKRIADYAELVIDRLRTDEQRPEYVKVPIKFTGGGTPKPGVTLRIKPDDTDGNKGVLVDLVIEGGPADMAGIKKGDIITEIAGKAVPTLAAYQVVMATLKSGVEVPITIQRDGKEMKLKATPK